MDTIISRTEREELQKLGISIPIRTIAENEKFTQNLKKRSAIFYYNPRQGTREFNKNDPFITISYTKSQFNNDWIIQYFRFQSTVPKCLYGSSYYLVRERDKERYFSELTIALKEIGISIAKSQLTMLETQSFTVAYNVLLPLLYGAPYTFLKRISFLDIGKHFRNILNTEYNETVEGFVSRVYSRNTSHKLYDKGSEIINQGQTPKERALARKIEEGKVPSRILRLEKVFQGKTAAKNAMKKHKGYKVEKVRLHEVFDEALWKENINGMVEKMGKLFHLISVDVAHKDYFLSYEAILRLGKKSGLKGANLAFFTSHGLAIGQMGVKNATMLFDSVLGRKKGQQYRSRLTNEISKKLESAELQGFFLKDLFDEIKKQTSEYVLSTTEEETIARYSEIEKRATKEERSETTSSKSANISDATYSVEHLQFDFMKPT